MANDETMRDATRFALCHVSRCAIGLSVRAEEFIGRTKESALSGNDLETPDRQIFDELQTFVTERLMPEYVEVWNRFRQEEIRLAGSLTGSLLQILDDLELEFQIQRVRFALDEYCGREWCALQFARWFDDVNCRDLLKEAGDVRVEDLPPIFQNDYAEQRALAGLRCFEQGVYKFYNFHLSWSGQASVQASGHPLAEKLGRLLLFLTLPLASVIERAWLTGRYPNCCDL